MIKVLTVCTGNICRSPVAAAALRHHLGELGVPIVTRSSGTMGGIANDSKMIKVAKAAGYDIADHESRLIDAREVDQFDLVLAMDRGHVQQIVAICPHAWHKVFTLPELVRRASGVSTTVNPLTFEEWLEVVGKGRTTGDVLLGPKTDDIDDPHGRRTRSYRAAVARIDDLAADLGRLLVSQIGVPALRSQES